MPTSGTGWIDYSCPVDSWEYWEGKEKFAQEFSLAIRTDLARVMFDFRNCCNDWEAEKVNRLDSKKIIRGLKAAQKTGVCLNSKLQSFVEMHCLDLPNKTFAEKAGFVLEEITANSNDFTMERPQPKPFFTSIIYDLFQRHGHSVNRGSIGDRYAMIKEAREADPLETAFIEFVRRCIWGEDRSSKFCDKVSKIITRHRNRSKP